MGCLHKVFNKLVNPYIKINENQEIENEEIESEENGSEENGNEENNENEENIEKREEESYRLYDNFNISSNQIICKIKLKENNIRSLCVLDDGRLVSGSFEGKIIIYNKITYKPDKIIKKFKGEIKLLKLNSNRLAIYHSSNNIILCKIIKNKCKIFQTLNYHTSSVHYLTKLNNNNLVSSSLDNSIIFYSKNKNKYTKYYQIDTNSLCMSITQINDNELCYSKLIKFPNYKIYFYDFNERKEKASISNIDSISNVLEMITKDILIVFGLNKLSLINVNKHILFRIFINTEWAFGFCKLNENMFLTGSGDGIISQWKIEDDNIALIHRKEKAHEKAIFTLIKIGKGIISSGSADGTIKFW